MATSIYFNGRRIVDPSAVSKIDASALQSVGPSAVGIVALLGTAEGGEPLTVALENDCTRPEAVREQYRDGDLKTGALFAFEPSQDEAIPGGAQRVIPVKVNPATQSTLQLADANSDPSVDLTTVDYGQFTAQMNIDVDAGTNQGKLISVNFEGTTETFDDVGGDAIMDVEYTPGADGFDVMTGAITSGAFTAAASKTEAGLNAELTASTPVGLPAGLEAVSAAGGDTTQTLTIYGLVGTTATQETISLNGTTAVPTAETAWSKVLGAVLSGATVGDVTLRVAGGGATALTLTAGVLTRGVVLTTNTPAAGALTVSIDVDTAVDVAVFGITAAGADLGERFDMTAGNTTPVVGSSTFGGISVIALGDVAAARAITVAVDAIAASTAIFTTIQRLTDHINTKDGFVANALASNAAELLVTEADYAAAISILSTAGDFFADLYYFVKAINDLSQFFTAERATGASLVPANTPAPLYATGGSEGATTITEWQEGFRLLKGRRANTIVPLTRDPAVHALLLSHLISRAGPLRSEANGYAGLADSDGLSLDLATLTSEIQALNTRHISAIPQEVKRFGVDTGVATWFAPHFLGAIAAGMQAGSPIGEPLTKKVIFALDIRQHSGWSIEDDKDTLIDRGAMVAEKVDGKGIRWVRSITTHLQNNNLVFTEMSANESANQAVFDLRNALDEKIGDRGLANSAGIIKGLATDALGRLQTDEIIAAWKPKTLVVEQAGDVFPVSVEIAPVVPINFIPITVHLVPLSAAA